VDAITFSGESPLRAAMKNIHKDAAVKLLQHKADMPYATLGVYDQFPQTCVNTMFEGREDGLLSFIWNFRNPVCNPQAFVRDVLLFLYIVQNQTPSFTSVRDNDDEINSENLAEALLKETFDDDDLYSVRQMFSDYLSLVALRTRNKVALQHLYTNCYNADAIGINRENTYSDSDEVVRAISLTANFLRTLQRSNSSDYSAFANVPFGSSCDTVVHFITDLKAVTYLLENGADVEAENVDGLRPIHCAVKRGNAKLVELLIQHGANVDAADVSDNRPLHHAVRHGLDVVQLLVQRGAKLNVQNNYGQTPLHNAVESQIDVNVIMFLLSQDADVGLTDVWRNNPLHYVTSKLGELFGVIGYGEYLAKLLIRKHKSLLLRNIIGISALEHITAHFVPVITSAVYRRQECALLGKTKYVDCQGNESVHHAVGVYDDNLQMFVMHDHVSKVVEFLVKHGADINAQNNAGLTPLHVARGAQAIAACLQHADHHHHHLFSKQVI